MKRLFRADVDQRIIEGDSHSDVLSTFNFLLPGFLSNRKRNEIERTNHKEPEVVIVHGLQDIATDYGMMIVESLSADSALLEPKVSGASEQINQAIAEFVEIVMVGNGVIPLDHSEALSPCDEDADAQELEDLLRSLERYFQGRERFDARFAKDCFLNGKFITFVLKRVVNHSEKKVKTIIEVLDTTSGFEHALERRDMESYRLLKSILTFARHELRNTVTIQNLNLAISRTQLLHLKRKLEEKLDNEQDELFLLQGMLDVIDGKLKAAADNVSIQTLLVEHLLNLENLRILTGNETGQDRIGSSGNIISIIQTAVSNFQEFAASKELNVIVDSAESLCDFSIAEIDALLIVNNLIHNAIKFNQSQGNVAIQARDNHTRLGRVLMLKVADTGLGIKKDFLAKIFNEGADSRERPDIEGLGVGLAVVKKIVDRLGGEISVISSEHGTTFTISIPEEKKLSALPEKTISP